jgi:hypothetical protein
METFTADKIHYFRAKVANTCPHSFEDVIRFFERECGMRRSQAIFAAAKTRGDLYNEFMRCGRRNAPNQSASPRPTNAPVHVLSMRSHTGKPIVAFKGL